MRERDGVTRATCVRWLGTDNIDFYSGYSFFEMYKGSQAGSVVLSKYVTHYAFPIMTPDSIGHPIIHHLWTCCGNH